MLQTYICTLLMSAYCTVSRESGGNSSTYLHMATHALCDHKALFPIAVT